MYVDEWNRQPQKFDAMTVKMMTTVRSTLVIICVCEEVFFSMNTLLISRAGQFMD